MRLRLPGPGVGPRLVGVHVEYSMNRMTTWTLSTGVVALVALAGLAAMPIESNEMEGPESSAAAAQTEAAAPLAAAPEPLSEETRGVANTAGYQQLESFLAAYPGFLALAPSPADDQVLNAYYTSSAPALGLAPTVPGWSLAVHEDVALDRLRLPVPTVTRLTPEEATALPSFGIGPGSPILQTIPNDGTYICSANYVFEDNGRYYLGSAGHCFMTEDATSTHGPDKDYNAGGVVVEVCVAGCYFGGFLQGFLGDMRELGQVTYARQDGAGGVVGNDFGVVEIPASLYGEIRPEMPDWGGPTGADGNEGIGSPLVHYGNGIDFGTVFVTKGRAGVGLNDGSAKSWQASVLINGGDSGSAINHVTGEALGIVTHGPAVLGVGIPGLGFGTTIEQAITMAREAGHNLRLMLAGEVPGDGGPPDPEPTAVHVEAIDQSYSHYAKDKGHRVTTVVTMYDDAGQPASGVDVTITVTSPEGSQSNAAGTTGADGTVSLTVSQRGGGHGAWESCVTAVGGIGYEHNSLADKESCDSIVVP